MNFVDLIIKKRKNQELTTEEINYFIDGVTNENIPDYQVSAMLMTICFNSLNSRETADLTAAMTKSGTVLDLSAIEGIKVDKHSTGGVADTTTLVLAPLAASCGLPVVKMSGRGLGHTGGTLDKLESIPNFNVNLTCEEAVKQVKDCGVVIMGQTSDLAPADKRLYAMRDVTGTVESIPLIAGSIMSKKLAAGTDAIVLDVKCGSGAFMEDLNSARELADTMVEIGKKLGKNVIAVITDMNQPLGMNIGNSLEVVEAIEILKGNVEGELLEVAITLGGYMLLLGEKAKDIESAKEMLRENIFNGKGLEKFREMIIAQGGDDGIIDDYGLLPHGNVSKEVISRADGYIGAMNTYGIGKAAAETGAGRHTKESKLDYGAGIILNKRIGDSIKKGEVIATIYASDMELCNKAENILNESIILSNEKPMKRDIILEVIQ